MRRTLLLVEIISRSTGLVLYSNGRADSPSYSAKFGYTIVVLHTNKVINVQLVQSNEVMSMYRLELEDLQRSLDIFISNDMPVSRRVTDRYASS